MTGEDVKFIRDELHKTRDAVHGLMLEVREHIAAQRQVCAASNARLEECRHTLYGNGQPGLKTLVTKMSVRINLLCYSLSVVGVAFVGQFLATIWKVLFP